jgi:hypothetical protein
VGRSTTATGTYRVLFPFRGFFQPISNRPFLNLVQAGQAVPVKFSLNGNRGLSIFAAGYPQVSSINCSSQAPVDDNVDGVNAGESSLNYDSATDTYNYVWKTDRAWRSSCRQLIIRLTDGSDHIAYFKFR